MIHHKEFKNGTMSTQFINDYFSDGLKSPSLTSIQKSFAKKAYAMIGDEGSSRSSEDKKDFKENPWSENWRNA